MKHHGIGLKNVEAIKNVLDLDLQISNPFTGRKIHVSSGGLKASTYKVNNKEYSNFNEALEAFYKEEDEDDDWREAEANYDGFGAS